MDGYKLHEVGKAVYVAITLSYSFQETFDIIYKRDY